MGQAPCRRGRGPSRPLHPTPPPIPPRFEHPAAPGRSAGSGVVNRTSYWRNHHAATIAGRAPDGPRHPRGRRARRFPRLAGPAGDTEGEQLGTGRRRGTPRVRHALVEPRPLGRRQPGPVPELTLPALLLAAVDEHDPIQVGQTETYTITIVNQGTGEDTYVQVTCKLPENYEFVGVEGPTEAKADGQTVIFQPIDRLDPGDTVRWHLKAKAKEKGDIQLRVELTSDYLSQPALSTEPTRLIK